MRRALHAAGLRYRVEAAPLPSLRRRADILFRPTRVAVFVDGCFWHGCPQHPPRIAGANAAYWIAKIARNAERDRETDRRLREAGWRVLRCWEHEDPVAVADRIERAVRGN